MVLQSDSPYYSKHQLVHMGLSLLTHILFLVPAIYVIVLCVGQNYQLFLWHPACMIVGCGLLMIEAVFAVSGEALFGSKIARTSRIKIHWVLHVLGLSLLIVGFSVIVANKNRNNASHFTSDHGRLGLSAVIISLVVALGGVCTLFAGLLSQKLSLATIKLVHGFGGIVCMILLMATLITGFYRPWWPGSSISRGLCVAAYVLGAFLVLLRPVYYTILKIRGLLCT